jgi:hypothetical protein
MSPPVVRAFGHFAARAVPADGNGDAPFSELSLSFVPLALVTEWARCSETADFVARFFAHDYPDRDIAGNVMSTIVNELVENAVKFSSDKAAPARLVVREYEASLTITTENVLTAAQADAFGTTLTRLAGADPELLFVEQIAHPPATGSAGIGLIMLRKDYDATIGARMVGLDSSNTMRVEVEVTIDHREVGSS